MGTEGKNSRVEQDRLLDEALEQTFPASDPIAVQQASVIGKERKTVSAGKAADKKTFRRKTSHRGRGDAER